MVMGRDSRSKGCGFVSRHHILDGHFSHLFVVKKFNVCLKRPKINKKEAGVGAFFLKKNPVLFFVYFRLFASFSSFTNKKEII